MFKKIATSLSKPPLAIFFMKDSWSKIFLYIFVLPIFLVLPSVFSYVVNPNLDASSYEYLYDTIIEDFRFDDVTIDNYELTYAESKYVSLETFDLAIGVPNSSNRLTFVFQTEGISVTYFDTEFDFQSYESLNLEAHDFSSTERLDVNQLTIAFEEVYTNQTFIFIAETLSQYLYFVSYFLMIILFMAFISPSFSPLMRMPFAMRFKMSTYISTIYVFTGLVLILTGLYQANTLGVILVYIYHLWVYRSIKVLPKGAINGKE